MDTYHHTDYIISLDLGGTKLLGILVNPSGDIKARLQLPSPKGNEDVKQVIIQLIASLMAEAKSLHIQPTGISIGVPGFIDTANGIMITADNLSIENLSLSRPIECLYSIPVKLYHDVRSATMGEAYFGVGKAYKHFALVNIGTGVAAGLFLDGYIYHGANHQSGEIGHLAVSAVGPNKDCAENNRLENLTSGPAIVRRAVAGLASHPESLIAALAGHNPERITSEIIQEAAEKGDAFAIQLINETADYLGMAIGGMLDILSLEAIILAGGVAHLGELLIRPLEKSLLKYAITPVPVFLTRVGRDLGALGAAALYFYSGE